MTNDMTMDDARAKRILQASDWFVRVAEDELTDAELAEWLQWCQQPENLLEFQRIRVTAAGFDQAHDVAAAMLNNLLAADPRPMAASTLGTSTKQRPRMGVRFAWFSAAAVACLAIGIWFIRNPAAVDVSSTVLISQDTNRSATLPDGSAVVLAPHTRLAYSFDGVRRHIALSQGEAYFKVQHDRSKPFVVSAGPLAVTAVGTAFDVRLESGRIVTLVQEGSVMVSDGGTSESATRLQLSSGYKIIYDLWQRAASVTAVDAERELGWRDGRLQYLNEPLRSVIEDISRYSGKRIELGDAVLGELRFTGSVYLESLDDWLGALTRSFPLRVTQPDAQHIVLMSNAGVTRTAAAK